MAKLDKRLKYQHEDEKPVTISMRLPKELHARLEQYATQYRQSISELVRDGLEWRLSEGDPRGLGAASTKEDEAYYISNTANALADMRQALARQEAQIQTIVQTLERQTTPAGNGLSEDVSYSVIHGTTALELEEQEPARAPKVKVDKEEVLVRIQQMRDKGLDSTQIAETLQAEGVPTLSAEAQLQAVVDMLEPRPVQDCSEGNARIPSGDGDMPVASMEVQSTFMQPLAGEDTRVSVPPYDPAKHRLGTLCPRSHDYQGTGQSLRKNNKAGGCLACDAEQARERRQRRRQEVSA